MYEDRVLDHYRNPRNVGVAEPAHVDGRVDNPLCGDEIRVTATVAGGALADVRFEGRGCALSQASASLLTERAKGATLADARALAAEDAVALLGVPVSAVRRKCALLALEALKAGLAAYRP